MKAFGAFANSMEFEASQNLEERRCSAACMLSRKPPYHLEKI